MTTATNASSAPTSGINEIIDVLSLLFGDMGPPQEKTAENHFPTFLKAVESLVEDLKDVIEDAPVHVVTSALGEVLAETLKRWPVRQQPGAVNDVVSMLYAALGAEIEIHSIGPDGEEFVPA